LVKPARFRGSFFVHQGVRVTSPSPQPWQLPCAWVPSP
jgi:hypothetical protein